MIKLNTISAKIILSISIIWLPFVVAGGWYDMKQSRKLALQEIERWGVSSGETVRIALNALMREGKMDARFSLFEDLTNEISQLKSIRVIRSPKVNEIFRRFRQENDIPREHEAIASYREEITGLLKKLDQTSNPDERKDIVNDITDISYEINHAEEQIIKLGKMAPIDPREVAQDNIDIQVIETGTPAFIVDNDTMRIVAPYKVRKTGCSEASGCHFYAKEGDVLGAVNMVFSIKEINTKVRKDSINSIIVNVLMSIFIFCLIYMAINHIIIRNLAKLTEFMKKISAGDFNVHMPLKRRKSDKSSPAESGLVNGDELDYLIDGFNSMAKKIRNDKNTLEKLAAFDSMTELYNRGKFTTSLREEVARHQHEGRALSLLIIDLDHFKNINDTYGHQVGDAALIAVSKLVNSHSRQNDIAARYGGEEIAVILPGTSNNDALVLAERMRKAIEELPIEYEQGQVIYITACIGVATLASKSTTDEELIQSADNALYIAKRDGRNCIRNATPVGKDRTDLAGPAIASPAV